MGAARHLYFHPDGQKPDFASKGVLSPSATRASSLDLSLKAADP